TRHLRVVRGELQPPGSGRRRIDASARPTCIDAGSRWVEDAVVEVAGVRKNPAAPEHVADVHAVMRRAAEGGYTRVVSVRRERHEPGGADRSRRASEDVVTVRKLGRGHVCGTARIVRGWRGGETLNPRRCRVGIAVGLPGT